MLRLAAQALLAYSERPLYWAFGIGLLVSLVSLIYGAYVIAIRLFTDAAVPGWASLAALIALLMGVQFVMIGLLGAYVAAIYAEVKRRPAYIVAEEFPPQHVP
jgi:polyisoprenyl-phosphate glycosyltransferase